MMMIVDNPRKNENGKKNLILRKFRPPRKNLKEQRMKNVLLQV